MTHNEAYDWAMGELEGRIAVGTILDYGLDIVMMLMTAGAYGPVIAAEKGAFIASKYALRTAKMAIPLVKKGLVPYMEGLTSEEVDPAWLKEQKAIAYALSAEQKKLASYEKSQREKLEKTKAKIVSKPKLVESIVETYKLRAGDVMVDQPDLKEEEFLGKTVFKEYTPSLPVSSKKKKKGKKKKEEIPVGGISRSTVGRNIRSFMRKRNPLSYRANLKRLKYEKLRKEGKTNIEAYAEIVK